MLPLRSMEKTRGKEVESAAATDATFYGSKRERKRSGCGSSQAVPLVLLDDVSWPSSIQKTVRLPAH